jgi:hypothetical protein
MGFLSALYPPAACTEIHRQAFGKDSFLNLDRSHLFKPRPGAKEDWKL